jgi:hypothetical protein
MQTSHTFTENSFELRLALLGGAVLSFYTAALLVVGFQVSVAAG